MGCLAGLTRHIERTFEYWIPRIDDAFQVAQTPKVLTRWGLTSPARGEANWGEWTVRELDPAACLEAAAIARQDAMWEDIKAAALKVGGCAASFVFYAALLVVAAAVFAIGFASVTLFGMYLEMTVSPLVGVVVSFFGGMGMGVLEMNIGLFMMSFAPRIWTKELLPAIARAENHAAHLRACAARLEAGEDDDDDARLAGLFAGNLDPERYLRQIRIDLENFHALAAQLRGVLEPLGEGDDEGDVDVI